ncbi:uncharacterized protein P884DRAFT_204435 [Thermothelomyces heterothallicus CBS 202.75]|uniref:uncharacterized protein n=1 Tax=Thermothelomyces heterothallicus CBS 202.75 TaxID=1149848 RepID=UPI0037435B1D
MKSPSPDEKVAFFDQLEALDYVSDGNDEMDEKERNHRDKCRAFFGSRKKAGAAAKGMPPTYPRRTASMPTPAATTRASRIIEATPAARRPGIRNAAMVEPLPTDTTTVVEETPVPDTARPPLPATLRRSTTFPTPSSPAVDQSPSASTALRKRKRQPSTKSVPEAAQIFQGLTFFYVPNNDIAPARKLRIGKAQEHGAQWVRSLTNASHVVVDKHLEYKDIESLLGSHARGSLVIVNEEYPIDCISFRTLLNPDQSRYRVTGFPGVKHKIDSGQAVPETSQSSDHSLRVKAPRESIRQSSRHSSSDIEQPSLPGCARDTQPDMANKTSPAIAGSTSEAHIPQASLSHHQSCNPTPKAPSPPPPGTTSTKDELSECIELLQQYKDLPLDAEEDDLQSVKDAEEASDSEIEVGSADERARKRTARARRTATKEIPFEERFACNRGGTKDRSADARNPNAHTIEILQRMCDYYARVNDTWRTLAYRKAIATLRRQPTRITTEDEAFRLPNIGRRLAAKIEEIACTNRLRRLEYANDEPLDRILELFLNVYDVGLSRANKWIAQGYRTLDDLRLKADLTPNQRIGVDHYDDLNSRIPRAEVAALFAYVRREAAVLDPRVELLVGGSYRRGAESSGDVDIIVTRKGTSSSAELVPFLEELIAVLTRKGFLVATLAALHAQRPGKDGPGSKWHGCCVWRRIDFLLVPESEYGAALIYFTGNDIFNRSMRLLASKKGMRLNQRGLYKEVMRGKNRRKVTEGELLEGRDEKRIFELLGVKWREPWERWC